MKTRSGNALTLTRLAAAVLRISLIALALEPVSAVAQVREPIRPSTEERAREDQRRRPRPRSEEEERKFREAQRGMLTPGRKKEPPHPAGLWDRSDRLIPRWGQPSEVGRGVEPTPSELRSSGQVAYDAHRLDEARYWYKQLSDHPDLPPKWKLEAQQRLERLDNLAVATSMPPGTLLLDTLSSAAPGGLTVHLVSGHSVLIDQVVQVDSLAGLSKYVTGGQTAPDLEKIQRIVVTPKARERSGTAFDFAEIFPDKIVWSCPDLEQGARNLKALSDLKISIPELALALLLPRNAEQQRLLGLDSWTDDNREGAWQASSSFIHESGISDIPTLRANRGGLIGWSFEALGQTRIRENLLESLKSKKGILIFFAHGDRDRLFLPDGDVLTAKDIAGLDLGTNRPVVLLFSCEGGKRGAASETGTSLADALKQAGASAAWTFQEKVDASESVAAARRLLEQIKSGKTTLDSIESVVLEWQTRRAPRLRLEAETRGQRRWNECANGCEQTP